jgi:ABC-type dipeptide/oligopeptide/nickel transport system permease component
VSPVLRYTGRRLLTAAFTLLVLTAIVFLMVKAIPGDAARVAAGPAASPDQVEAMRKRLGLDQSIFVQYWKFLTRLAHGDLGTSITSHNSITSDVRETLPATIQLVLVALLIMTVLAVPVAIWSALRDNKKGDGAVRAAIVVSAGLPTFWLALVLQYLLATRLGWLPISGFFSRDISVPRATGMSIIDAALNGNPTAFIDAWYHLLLPAFVLALPFVGQLYRTLRTDLVAVLDSEYTDAARAKGVSQRRLVLRHALPNAAGSAVTVLGATFGILVGASVLVESVFGLTGIGSYLTQAVGNADRLAVVGGVLVIGTLVVASSLIVDLIEMARDPRIRAGQIAT